MYPNRILCRAPAALTRISCKFIRSFPSTEIIAIFKTTSTPTSLNEDCDRVVRTFTAGGPVLDSLHRCCVYLWFNSFLPGTRRSTFLKIGPPHPPMFFRVYSSQETSHMDDIMCEYIVCNPQGCKAPLSKLRNHHIIF